MSHRLQVLLDENEIAAVRAAARRRRLTLSEYVRQALRDAREEPGAGTARKLTVVREASEHAYPTADPEAREREIVEGYLGERIHR
jgi:Arc/MetJ-type ribon-helix-helix transcriptional regulator